MMKSNLSWVENMKFVSETRGLSQNMDAASEHGGSDFGPSPKEFVLNAMMGCTAMDVVAILKKMRQEMTEFKMEIEAEKTLEHPIHFKSAELIFRLKGNIDPEKAIKAVESSLTRYCGVNYMISKTCAISFTLFLNDSMIKQGPVIFIGPNNEGSK